MIKRGESNKKIFYITILEITLIILFIISISSILNEINIASAKTASNLGSDTNNVKGVEITAFIENIFKGDPTTSACSTFAPLCAGFAWGSILALGVNVIGGLLGLDSQLQSALTKSVFVGSIIGGGAANLIESGIIGGADKTIMGLNAKGFGTVVGIGVAVAVFLATYKKEKQQLVSFQCLPYEPPLGGAECAKCNEDEFRPCSEYRCRSLGQACELVNAGTVEEQCVWVSPQDVTSPTIKPWEEVLTQGHVYKNHNTRPPSLGTAIINNAGKNGCLQAFTPLKFGIQLNEPAQCKIDYTLTDTYDEMQFYFGETNYYLTEHEQTLSLPSPDSLNSEAIAAGAPQIQNNGQYDLYVRCQDRNGNENVDAYAIGFCVDPSPDTTPPVIISTSILDNSPVAFDVGNISLQVNINEPAICKWSVQDKNYDDMENTMTCSTSVIEQNAQQLYPCTTTLTGIKNNANNQYYFRCKDQPSKQENERNVNVQSYSYSIKGTQPLNIIKTSPNNTITDSTDVVTLDLEIETSNGANEGKAICYFSPTGLQGSYIAMFETNSFTHSQTLSLTEGDYNYYFRCVDVGGNSDETTTQFNVLTDTNPPQVTKAYHELDAIKIVTNENAQCVYSLNNCNYNPAEGLSMIYSNPSIKNNHYAPWKPNTAYYIKCVDLFGNQPAGNECSIIASATTIN